MKNVIVKSLIIFLLVNTAFGDVKVKDDVGIAHFVAKKKISPFEMPSLSISHMEYSYDRVLDATGGIKTIKGGSLNNVMLRLEQPVYKKYISYGLDFGASYSFKPFAAIATDTTLSLKLRAPFQLGNAGDFALTVSGGIGISTIYLGRIGKWIINKECVRYEPSYEDDDGKWVYGKNTYKETKEAGVFYLRFGVVKTLTYGIDYYPIKWLGISVELQSRYYDYRKDQFKKSDITEQGSYLKKVSYKIENALTIGFKTTF